MKKILIFCFLLVSNLQAKDNIYIGLNSTTNNTIKFGIEIGYRGATENWITEIGTIISKINPYYFNIFRKKENVYYGIELNYTNWNNNLIKSNIGYGFCLIDMLKENIEVKFGYRNMRGIKTEIITLWNPIYNCWFESKRFIGISKKQLYISINYLF